MAVEGHNGGGREARRAREKYWTSKSEEVPKRLSQMWKQSDGRDGERVDRDGSRQNGEAIGQAQASGKRLRSFHERLTTTTAVAGRRHRVEFMKDVATKSAGGH